MSALECHPDTSLARHLFTHRIELLFDSDEEANSALKEAREKIRGTSRLQDEEIVDWYLSDRTLRLWTVPIAQLYLVIMVALSDEDESCRDILKDPLDAIDQLINRLEDIRELDDEGSLRPYGRAIPSAIRREDVLECAQGANQIMILVAQAIGQALGHLRPGPRSMLDIAEISPELSNFAGKLKSASARISAEMIACLIETCK